MVDSRKRKFLTQTAPGAIAAALLPRSHARAGTEIPPGPLRDLGEFVAIDKNGNDINASSLARLLEERPATLSFGYIGCGNDHKEMHTMLSELKSTIQDLVYVVIDVDDPAVVGRNPGAVLPQTLKEMQNAGMKGDMVVIYPKDTRFINTLQIEQGGIPALDPRVVTTVGLYDRNGRQVEIMDNGDYPSPAGIRAANAAAARSR